MGDIGEELAGILRERQEVYGIPTNNFELAGRLIELFRNAQEPGTHPAVQAATEMILHKVARLAHSPHHRDTLIDIAGYAACAVEITDEVDL